MSSQIKSLSLIELIVAIILLSLVILTLAGVEYWARSSIIDSGRRTSLEGHVSIVLEHMTKQITGTNSIGGAIGNVVLSNPVDTTPISGDTGIKVIVDSNSPWGQQDVGDRRIAYRFTGTDDAPANRNQIWYYSNCVNPNCTGAGSATADVIATNIEGFNVIFPPTVPPLCDNCVSVTITACQRPTPPAGISTCGTPNNPEVTMSVRIKMPAVSTN